jgi:hypothetical protein
MLFSFVILAQFYTSEDLKRSTPSGCGFIPVKI